MYDHTNRFTTTLSMDVFSPEKSRAKCGINPGASKYVGIEQLGWCLLIDVVCQPVGNGPCLGMELRKSYR